VRQWCERAPVGGVEAEQAGARVVRGEDVRAQEALAQSAVGACERWAVGVEAWACEERMARCALEYGCAGMTQQGWSKHGADAGGVSSAQEQGSSGGEWPEASSGAQGGFRRVGSSAMRAKDARGLGVHEWR
jgi:hypothetical protein